MVPVRLQTSYLYGITVMQELRVLCCSRYSME